MRRRHLLTVLLPLPFCFGPACAAHGDADSSNPDASDGADAADAGVVLLSPDGGADGGGDGDAAASDDARTPDARTSDARADDASRSDASGSADAGGGTDASCDDGLTSCAGVCVNLSSDPSHCGSCEDSCPAPDGGHGDATCSGKPAACGLHCDSGYHACKGGCRSDSDDPSDPSDGCILGAVGVFVAPPSKGGSDAQAGTAAAPYATIGHALANLKGTSRVFVCDGTYAEAVVIDQGVSVFGGLDCTHPTEWVYQAGTTADVVAPAGQVALTIANIKAAVVVQDMTFRSPEATGTDAAGNGASSIAGWIAASTQVELTRLTFTAGDGAPAAAGAPHATNWYGGEMVGQAATGVAGVSAIECTCRDGVSKSVGGAGGDAAYEKGDPGGDGLASPSAVPYGAQYDGKGGHGAYKQGECNYGKYGAPGRAGKAGANAPMLGVFDSAGWHPVAGTAGGLGGPGQGGGGGGGGNAAESGELGGSGGSCGGCGGAPGSGGTAGGSSFALVVLDSSVDSVSVRLQAGNGQEGGNGSGGENGEPGGNAYPGPGSCGGGWGGAGGGGGGGGGGAGGSSVGIAWTQGSTVVVDGATIHGEVTTASYFTGGSFGPGGSNQYGGYSGDYPSPGEAGHPYPGVKLSHAIDGVVAAARRF